MLLYIHGFNSTAASHKAGVVRGWLEDAGAAHQFRAPTLSHWPREAMETLEALVRAGPPEATTVIGSSLGGFYATWLAERFGVRAILVNPAIRPYESMRPYLGPQRNLYSAEAYQFEQAHLDQLRALEAGRLSRPERCLLMVRTGDEVIDYRLAVERYTGSPQIVLPGGDHGFSDFGQWRNQVFDFARPG